MYTIRILRPHKKADNTIDGYYATDGKQEMLFRKRDIVKSIRLGNLRVSNYILYKDTSKLIETLDLSLESHKIREINAKCKELYDKAEKAMLVYSLSSIDSNDIKTSEYEYFTEYDLLLSNINIDSIDENLKVTELSSIHYSSNDCIPINGWTRAGVKFVYKDNEINELKLVKRIVVKNLGIVYHNGNAYLGIETISNSKVCNLFLYSIDGRFTETKIIYLEKSIDKI